MKLRFMPLFAGVIIFSTSLSTAAFACGASMQRTSLTQEQQLQLQQIQGDTLEKVSEILPPQQREQFRGSIASGQRMREALASLNLSSEQREQIQQVMQAYKTQKQQLLNSN